jgi:uncharacterized protein (TIGR03492 family)
MNYEKGSGEMEKKILVLSNGHGEDIIAVRILEQLKRYPDPPKLAALPIVGEGHAYSQLAIPIIGTVQQMPSGGFIYMDRRQLWRDLQGGLLQLTIAQYQAARKWGKSGGKILAVGDIVPLFIAWLSGADYAFVGTAKSDYYLRDEREWLPKTSVLERWCGSIYFPWERWLMKHSRCQAVFPRDTLTAEILQRFSIPAFDLGNPMMDGIETIKNSKLESKNEILAILLLPGSRLPEAGKNWQKILASAGEIVNLFSDKSVVFIAAIAPALSLQPFQEILLSQGWILQPLESLSLPISDAQAVAFTHNGGTLILTKQTYSDCLQIAHLAIAMAGTATEQFVGLGKPAIIIPGEGPQFTAVFAEAQTRLLGCSVTLVEQPQQVAGAIQLLLQDTKRLQEIAKNGRRRMGKSGAAARIANCLQEKLLY